MGNINYCKYENTYDDLLDCFEYILEGDDDLSESEQRYKEKLIDLCDGIHAEFKNKNF
jgi:hypothetical protein